MKHHSTKGFLTLLLICLTLFSKAQQVEDFLANDNSYHGFIENKGQVVDQWGKKRNDVLFSYQTNKIQIFITEKGLSYQFSSPNIEKSTIPNDRYGTNDKVDFTVERVDVEFDQQPNLTQTVKEKNTGYTENYYLAQCMEGITNVAAYSKITFKNIYPNIDWVLYAYTDYVKYDFVVRKNANTSTIQLNYKGAKNLYIDETGNLIIQTNLGSIKEEKPIYLSNNKEQIGTYQLINNSLTFKNISKDFTGTIDPKIIWSTFYGGINDDRINNLVVDANDNLIATGRTASTTNIATIGAFQTTFNGSYDILLVKFNSGGTRLWATYYGGNGHDAGLRMDIDNAYNVYIVGVTHSDTVGWATSGAFQSQYGGGSDGFILKFDSSGKRLWSTYIGSSKPGFLEEYTTGIVYNASKNEIYVTGTLYDSIGIVTTGTHQNQYGGGKSDAYLAAFDTAGRLNWGTFFGGAKDEQLSKLTLGKNGKIYLSGLTKSFNQIATSGTYRPSYFSFNDLYWELYLASFNNDGTQNWSTYYGDFGDEYCEDIKVDNDTNIYIMGIAVGSLANLGTPNTFSPRSYTGSSTVFDGFITKFTHDGQRVWGTYLGTDRTFLHSLYIDEKANLFFCGSTKAIGLSGVNNLAVNNAFQPTISGGDDGVIMQFDSTGNIITGTYYGGTSGESLESIIQDSKKRVYTAGFSSSTSKLTMVNGHQMTLGGGSDGIIAKFDSCWGFIHINKISSVCPFDTVTLKASGAQNYTWETFETTDSIVVVLSTTKDYWVKGFDARGCFDSAWINIKVVPKPTVTIVGDSNICKSEQLKLKVTGTFANSYLWSTGNKTDELKTFIDSTTKVWCYVRNYLDCGDTIYKTVKVLDENFNIQIDGASSICEGNSATLTAKNGNNYSWLHGPTGSTVSVSPQITTQYTVEGQNDSGCVDTSNFTVVVNSPLNNLTLQQSKDTICIGDFVTIKTIGAYTKLSWTTGDTAKSIFVIPDSTTLIGLDYIDTLGCYNSLATKITVGTIPTILISGTDTTCAGDTATLIASGANSYFWDTNDTSSTINTSPKTSKSYFVRGTTIFGCSNTDTFDVFVKQRPILSISGNQKPTQGDTVTYTATIVNGYMYLWNMNNGVALTPSTFNSVDVEWGIFDTGWVALQIKDSVGLQCSNTDTLYISIAKPTPPNPNISVQEIQQHGVQIYPNPFSKGVTIYNPENISLLYSLTNIEGKPIFSGTINTSYNIDASNLPSGIYLLTINNKTTKLIKN